MKYDFDEIIDRSNNRAAKYDERVKKFGTSEVIPLWIADMDFRTAQSIIDACKRKAEEGVWGYTSRPDSYFKAVQEWEKGGINGMLMYPDELELRGCSCIIGYCQNFQPHWR